MQNSTIDRISFSDYFRFHQGYNVSRIRRDNIDELLPKYICLDSGDIRKLSECASIKEAETELKKLTVDKKKFVFMNVAEITLQKNDFILISNGKPVGYFIDHDLPSGFNFIVSLNCIVIRPAAFSKYNLGGEIGVQLFLNNFILPHFEKISQKSSPTKKKDNVSFITIKDIRAINFKINYKDKEEDYMKRLMKQCEQIKNKKKLLDDLIDEISEHQKIMKSMFHNRYTIVEE
jgi:hypothetical protein